MTSSSRSACAAPIAQRHSSVGPGKVASQPEAASFQWERTNRPIKIHIASAVALAAALKAEGCDVLPKIEESEYGKFAWVMDPEGNKVELWQPPPGQ